MRAVRFDAPIPRYLVTRAAGALSDRLLVGPHACTKLVDMARPDLPGDDWVRVRTRLGGICGSDLAIVTLSGAPSTSPFSSFPFVLGHENVGEVVETGPAAREVPVGTRVVVNPLLPCRPRAIDPPCPDCAEDRPQRCAHFTGSGGSALPAGMFVGTTHGLGGSWGEEFVAHASQLVPVPDHLDDEAAVLVEPFACCVHAVRADLPAAGERVLVIGAGAIGLLTTAALAALVPRAEVTVLARHAFQAEHAERLGAARTVRARDGYEEALAELSGARLIRPILGPRIAVGGFDRVYVCVGGARAMGDALRFARSGGAVVLLGNVHRLDGVDWTPLWLKELTVRGSLAYGGAHPGAPSGAFREAMALVADGRAPLGPLLTHTFPLGRVRDALRAAMDKGGEESVKVAFRF